MVLCRQAQQGLGQCIRCSTKGLIQSQTVTRRALQYTGGLGHGSDQLQVGALHLHRRMNGRIISTGCRGSGQRVEGLQINAVVQPHTLSNQALCLVDALAAVNQLVHYRSNRGDHGRAVWCAHHALEGFTGGDVCAAESGQRATVIQDAVVTVGIGGGGDFTTIQGAVVVLVHKDGGVGYVAVDYFTRQGSCHTGHRFATVAGIGV